MGFVEGVFREVDHLVVDGVGGLLVDAVGNTALHSLLRIAVDEVLPLLFHHCGLFLGHGAAHQIASAQRVAGQIPHNLHYLLLVDDAAVGGA